MAQGHLLAMHDPCLRVFIHRYSGRDGACPDVSHYPKIDVP